MDWNALQDFLTVAETGSLSAASRRLNVSQPTVGRRIEQLETSLNTVLFQRTPRGLLLTRSGENILESARQMQAAVDSVERKVSGENQQLQGLVRISLCEALGAIWLPQRLAEFHEAHPALQLELHVDDEAVNLSRREADIAVRLGRPDQDELVARRVGALHFGLYASPAYLESHGTPDTLSALKDHLHVGYDHAMQLYTAVQRLEGLFRPDAIRHRTSSRIGLHEATASGLGLAALTCITADRDPRLQRVLVEQIDYSREIWLVSHSDILRSARVRSVYDFLAGILLADERALRGIAAHVE